MWRRGIGVRGRGYTEIRVLRLRIGNGIIVPLKGDINSRLLDIIYNFVDVW